MPMQSLSRRAVLAGGAALSLVPLSAAATPAEMQAAVDAFAGGRPITDGRVTLDSPAIAENGNSVSLTVDVESPMTAADHVRTIAVFAEANPLPNIVRFHLSPLSGRARVGTRIRLNDTQTILALAEMSDGSLWAGRAQTIVTLAACGIIL